ncbi:50S ribosomal protein L3 N(5)-glutamine methyltransferase [endosymbiont of Pachyrhynchus infernalis]|uniref:50S ribosomal protein L3 N(5)-glutamine methyltransferase n=1 Tax=endosymbiont of Pachyrhynchus infernalis TaxID=1971488 RepID=UPI000DC70DA2|nr:50S ribosomal protein L3 N(5)-glutamine methyltransferase [endosymbiont of Pachyrhynchus infernalis]BBA84920.1 50S ribosomal protein L3 glutamine methyltransferase [endosymbiont of Pachyrhynchus infernalis]
MNKIYTVKNIIILISNKFKKSNIFYGHGSLNCFDEAKNFILSYIGINNNLYFKYKNTKISNILKSKIFKLLYKRIYNRIPVFYLTNRLYLYNLEFFINKNVVIPRSHILEIISNKFTNIINYYPNNILDLCTGSGCLAILAAKIFFKSNIYASDICNLALNVAKKNIIINNINNIVLFRSDIYKSIPNINFDIILTNPPYVNIKDKYFLPKEYIHEPSIGLFAKNNGLEFINEILINSINFLTNRGVLICEIGDNYNKLINLYPNIKFNWININSKNKNVFFLKRTELKKYKKYFVKKL